MSRAYHHDQHYMQLHYSNPPLDLILKISPPPPPEAEPPSVTEEREQLAAWERKEKEMKDAGIPIPPPPLGPIPQSAKRLKYPWLLALM